MKEAVRLTPIVAIAKFERIYPITLHPNPWYRMVMANFGLHQGSVKSSFYPLESHGSVQRLQM